MTTTTTHLNPSPSIGAHLASASRTQLVDAINAAAATGREITIAGRKAWSPYGRNVAAVWGNGSISVDVRPRGNGRQAGTVWIKVGESVDIEGLRS